MLLVASMLAGAFYWNDQLSFGVDLPKNFPSCTGIADTPDRGVYVLLRMDESCPNLNEESLFEYVERRKIPSVSVVAWYNTVEEFRNSSELAEAYCKTHTHIYQKRQSYGDFYYCFVSKGEKSALRGFVQLHRNTHWRETVNVEFHLNDVRKTYLDEYWRMVGSLSLSAPSASLKKGK